MNRVLCLLSTLLLMAELVSAQTAVVTRNVNLRSDPSTEHPSLAKFMPGTQLDLLAPEPTEGFLHVKTADGIEGWVWSRNVHLQAPTIASTLQHVGPAQLYPDSVKTPGLADTLSLSDLTKAYTENCPASKTTCTYSQSHRNVPESVRKRIYDEYNVPQAKRNIKNGEVDHFYPLCAGGSNDPENLWYQPAVNDWNSEDFGFHAKDKLEAYVCIEIKSGKLDPKEAYERMTKDWVKFYLDEGLNDIN